jgi:hypothetical protein
MLLRKTNAILSLITTLLLLDHAIFSSVSMISMGAVKQNASFMPWMLVGLMMMHAVISMGFAFSAHSETEENNGKTYTKQNIVTLIQRISGILLIALTALHAAEASGVMQPPKFILVIVPPLFYAIALAHVAISTSKAFITLGVGNAKVIKAIDIVTKVICGATLIAAIVGFYLYKV